MNVFTLLVLDSRSNTYLIGNIFSYFSGWGSRFLFCFVAVRITSFVRHDVVVIRSEKGPTALYTRLRIG